ncbi:YeiH family protein [Puia dinghuensis]|uniref:UPF0324 membrane protein n=1 Tax=Puia dinghuensis TaxID=1792502 RepID=A0A8J2UC45_9BACT|nr:putative sulfate exporter family transporter [Puia dinghuensis]GGA95012.1 UPF0324 membrane protein [Puia dinghuensis]
MDTSKVLDRHISIRQMVFAVAVLFCLTPLVTPPLALVLGLIIALFVGHPFLHLNHKATHILLQVSVVGLGFGMNAATALKAGREGFLFTVVSIAGTLGFGLLLGFWMKIDKKTSLLISGGTAICGGSAIAALAPVIRAEERQVSVALGAVFILNSVALFVFPVVGHWLGLSQAQFGLWSAIAIHDTSSVVGAAGRYGPEALQIATTVKLARALWIIPVSLLAALFFRGGAARKGGAKVKVPYFIGLFVLAILWNTWVPMPAVSHVIVGASHAGLTLTLFLIGSGLSRQVLRQTGVRPLVQGVIVWVLIAGATLWAVMGLAG